MSRVSLIRNGLGTQVGDNTKATITSATIASGTYTAGDDVFVTLTFSEAINTTATPGNVFGATVTLFVGASDVPRTATYDASRSATAGVTGETANKLVFKYTVQSGEVDTNGITIKADSLVLANGSSIVDRSANLNTSDNFSFAAVTNTAAVIPAPPVGSTVIAINPVADNILSATEGKAFTLSGTATNATAVTVTFADTDANTPNVVATATVTGGNWTLAATDLTKLKDGAVTATVTSGTATAATTSLTLDTVADAAPAALNLAAADDTGASQDDNLTKNTTALTIDGTGVTGSTVRLFADADSDGVVDAGESLGTVLVSGGVFSLDVSLAQGVHNVRAIQTDSAGNASVASTALVVTVDTVAPSVDVAKIVVAGNDAISSSERANFAVVGQAGAIGGATALEIKISDGTTTITKAGTAAADGSFTIGGFDATALGAGTLTVAVTATDAAGNQTSANDSAVNATGLTIAAQSTTFVEGNATLSYQVTAIPADGTAITNYEITGGNPGGVFAIANDGKITLTRALDVDPTPGQGDPLTYALTVKATDNQGTPQTATATVTINVTDVNDIAPIFKAAGPTSVSEATKVGETVITVVATDGDLSPAFKALTYSIKDGNTGDAFAIDKTTGAITLAKALDFESTTKSYSLVVEATDGVNPRQQTYVINVTDAEDAPVATISKFVIEDDGSPAVLTTASLKVTDVDSTNAQIQFTVTSISPTTLGQLVDRGDNLASAADDVPLGVGVTFTYDEVVDGRITLREFGGDTSGSIVLSMTNSGTGEGTVAPQTVTIPVSIVPVNIAPEIRNEGAVDTTTKLDASTRSETAASTPERIDPSINLVDKGTTDFNGGFLTVSVDDAGVEGIAARAGDALSIATAGGITVSGSAVSFNGAVIGTIDATQNGVFNATTNATAALKINLAGTAGAAVTRGAVEALAEAIAFSTTDQSTTADVGSSRTVTFLLNDGESLPKEGSNTATITITGVNTAPTLTTATAQQTTNEDTPLIVTGVSVADPDSTALTVTLAATKGTLAVAPQGGAVWTAGAGTLTGSIAAVNASLVSGLTYTPNLNSNGADTLTITVRDNTVPTALSSATRTINLTVNSVNDLPTAADGTVVARQGGSYTFKLADFGFTDVEGTTPSSVTIQSRAGVDGGQFRLNDVAVQDLQTITRSDIEGGKLTYSVAANVFGVAYDAFTFKVTDADGGTSLAAYTMSIDVTAKPTVERDGNLILGGEYLTVENKPISILGLKIADEDSTAGMTVRLGVTAGTLSASENAYEVDATSAGTDVTVTTIDAKTLQLSGSLANVNKVLAGSNISYTLGSGSGSDTLTVTAYDGAVPTSAGASKTYSLSVSAISNEYVFDTNNSLDYGISDPETSIYDVATGANVGLEIRGFGVTGGGLATGEYDTLYFDDHMATDVTYLASKETGNTTLKVGDQTITIVGFTDSLDGIRVTFNDGSLLRSNTTETATLLTGGAKGDLLVSGDAGDTLRGGAGADVLIGNGGRDFLYGGAGNDTLVGGAGGDRFFGGIGADKMYAAAQSDVLAAQQGTVGETDLFVYRFNESEPNGLVDEIYGFRFKEDYVVLSDFMSFRQVDYTALTDENNQRLAVDVGAEDTEILLNGGAYSIKLMGVGSAELGNPAEFHLLFAGASILNS
jgi:large repetitive protein